MNRTLYTFICLEEYHSSPHENGLLEMNLMTLSGNDSANQIHLIVFWVASGVAPDCFSHTGLYESLDCLLVYFIL